MGFAWQNLSHERVLPFWQDVIEQMADQRFSFYLQRNEKWSDFSSAGGELVLGGVNPEYYTGDFHYVKSRTDFWSIPLDSLTVNGEFVATSPNNVNLANAAIDTGTSFIIGPEDKVAAIYAKVPGAERATEAGYKGHWKFPCKSNFTVSFSFGGVDYPIPFRDLVFTSSGDDFNTAMCMGSIYTLDGLSAGVNDWIIGDAFLKNVYTTFRYEPPAVGFAQLAPKYALSLDDRPDFGAGTNGSLSLSPNATVVPVAGNVSATLAVPTDAPGVVYTGTASGPGNPDNTATLSTSYNQTATTKSNIEVLSTSGVAVPTTQASVQVQPTANAASGVTSSASVTTPAVAASASASATTASTSSSAGADPASTAGGSSSSSSGAGISPSAATTTAAQLPAASPSGTKPPPKCRPKRRRAERKRF
ncbi:hypothetical protein VHUM_02311 [Vanrija humicola]|uniref:Peptidase A1 domain-containing protein n=1 Tax=Vanrija humicola TaxID=5417 RepID=A0A7D8V208_VANHU|nr:hypothetical protein VHUM_02311 [Vanrija humicola]